MSNNQELQQHVQRIGALVQELESIADPSVRASAKELVQLLMEFHGAGLDRALEIVANTGDPGLRLIGQLGDDPLVGSLLVLYGLHPDDVDTRARKALGRVQPKVQRSGGELEVLEVANGSVRVRLSVTGHYEAALDVSSIVIEGLDDKPSGGFVSLDKLLGGIAVPAEASSAREQAEVSATSIG